MSDLEEGSADPQALREDRSRAEAHLYRTLERLPIGIAYADNSDRIRRVNKAFSTLLGYAEPELIGKTFAELTHPDDVGESVAAWERLKRREVETYTIEKRYIRKDGSSVWARVTVGLSHDYDGVVNGDIAVFEDISQRKSAEIELDKIHRELLRSSHQAGMAEVATNVLHNVGNVLNSLNVAANLLTERIHNLEPAMLSRVIALLEANASELGSFLTEEGRGRKLLDYLKQVSRYLDELRRDTLTELGSMSGHIDHIKHIVTTQQSYATRCGVTETVAVATLVEDSLSMNRGAFTRHGVVLVREFADVPRVTVDKHKVLQILVNLERNAKYACDKSGNADKRVTVHIAPVPAGVQIQVRDNGVGIAPTDLGRLFSHGFTTKKDGHGFGLHSSALAAKDLGGMLEAFSEGLGRGATFTLTLPLVPPERGHG